MSDCVFCQIIAGDAPAVTVYEWDDTVAFLPSPDKHGNRGCTPGHTLFVPRLHVVDAADRPRITGQVAERAAQYASETGQPFNLITSAGAVATQTVFHLHWHFVPRRPGDGLHLPWTNQHLLAAPTHLDGEQT